MHKYCILSIIICLCACDVGREYKIEDFISDEQIKNTLNLENNGKKISIKWYEIFNDKDLNTLLKDAGFYNLSLRQGKEKLLQARYLYMINTKETLPMFNANFEYDFSKANNSKDILNNSNFFRTGFDVSWEIDLWGKSKNVSSQYYEIINKAKYSIANTLISLEGELISNYISLRLAQEKLKIANKNLRLQENILRIVKDKYNTGLEDKLALNQAQFLLEKTKTDIPVLLTEIEKYKNAIFILSGKTAKDLSVNLDKFQNNITSKTFKYNIKDLYKLPLDVIRSRPDVKMAEASIKSQNSYLNQAIIDLYPSLSLEASFVFLSSRGSNLFNSDNQIYGYNPKISIPIWQWGKLVNNIELQKHIKEEYILNYNEVTLTALYDIKNAITGIEQAFNKCRLLENSLYTMRDVLDISKEKYKNGLIDFSTLAESEQNFLDTENSYIEANSDVLKSITSFYKACGGGYSFK